MAMEGKDEKDASELMLREKYAPLLATLPFNDAWTVRLWKYQHVWYADVHLPGGLSFIDNFKPRATDILLISPPKSGTTWLKALTFATVNRIQHPPFDPNHPLLCMNPHACIPMADEIFGSCQESMLDTLPPPRLLASHIHYSLLPESITTSGCKFIYVCREPKDTFVSVWNFLNALPHNRLKPLQFGEAFEMFCEGISPCGPIWDHYLECWRESLRTPEKVLFLKYEEMMEDSVGNLKRLAEFIGCPFSQEEEKEGVAEGIVRLCSFENLKAAKGNQEGARGPLNVSNSTFFRKGKVGDWRNYLTLEMAQRLDKIIEERLRGSGLSFSTSGSERIPI